MSANAGSNGGSAVLFSAQSRCSSSSRDNETTSLDEAATTQPQRRYKTTRHESSSTSTSESAFDQLYREYLANNHLNSQFNKMKPQFVPVLYDAEDPPRKFRRMLALGHELDLREKLADSVLGDKEIKLYARLATYYPGSRYQALDRVLTYSLTPPRISLTNSDEESSPKYLFKDPPLELPKAKNASSASLTSYVSGEWPLSPPFLKTPERQIRSPKTPDSAIGDDYETPETPMLELDHPSPIFDGLKLRRQNIKRYFKSNSLESSESSTIVVNSSHTSSTLNSERNISSNLVETPVILTSPKDNESNVVRFVKAGQVGNVHEPLEMVIGTFRLKSTTVSKHHSTSLPSSRENSSVQRRFSAEQHSSSLPSSKTMTNTDGSFANQASSYRPSYPIVILVPELVRRKYPELLAQFVTEFGVEIVDGEFKQRVTHVVLDDDGNLMESDVKVEHIQAIGFKKDLVNLNWIRDSILARRILDPAYFEAILSSRSSVPPTRLAKNSSNQLFEGYVFLCAKPFVNRINYEQLVELLEYNGGEVVHNPEDFANYRGKIRLCIIGERVFYDNEQHKRKLRHRLAQCQCVKVHYRWVFQVFATYSIGSLIDQLYDSTLEDARIAGVPERLLV